jgi:predicted nucleic-acid-binding protein
MIKNKPSICLLYITNNSESNILEKLNNVHSYIDYWIISDILSQDNTTNLICDFFEEKNIDGELYIDDWVSISHNINLLLSRCHKKSDFFFILNDADFLNEKLDFFSVNCLNYLSYFIKNKSNINTCFNEYFFNNHFTWKSISNSFIKLICTDNTKKKSSLYINESKFYIFSKLLNYNSITYNYFNCIKLLKTDFKNTLIYYKYKNNSKYAFFIAEYYYYNNLFNEALEWYSLYCNLKNTDIIFIYQSSIKISKCMYEIKNCLQRVDNNILKLLTFEMPI